MRSTIYLCQFYQRLQLKIQLIQPGKLSKLWPKRTWFYQTKASQKLSLLNRFYTNHLSLKSMMTYNHESKCWFQQITHWKNLPSHLISFWSKLWVKYKKSNKYVTEVKLCKVSQYFHFLMLKRYKITFKSVIIIQSYKLLIKWHKRMPNLRDWLTWATAKSVCFSVNLATNLSSM